MISRLCVRCSWSSSSTSLSSALVQAASPALDDQRAGRRPSSRRAAFFAGRLLGRGRLLHRRCLLGRRRLLRGRRLLDRGCLLRGRRLLGRAAFLAGAAFFAGAAFLAGAAFFAGPPSSPAPPSWPGPPSSPVPPSWPARPSWPAPPSWPGPPSWPAPPSSPGRLLGRAAFLRAAFFAGPSSRAAFFAGAAFGARHHGAGCCLRLTGDRLPRAASHERASSAVRAPVVRATVGAGRVAADR